MLSNTALVTGHVGGWLDGDTLGISDGARLPEGLKEGKSLMVGAAVGDVVGAIEGEAVGEYVGSNRPLHSPAIDQDSFHAVPTSGS